MAIEVFPDSPIVGRSPRISFSHDLSQTDVVPVEQYIGSSSSSSVDFDFCVFRESFEQESSSADELFFNGKILPIEIKKRLAPAVPSKRAAPPVSPPPPPPPVYDHILDSSKSSKKIPTESEEKQNSSKSFWRFKRSTSLNCGSGYARTLCPLPILSRSNSTGSASSSKRSSVKQSQSLSTNSNTTTTHQRPPLKKNHASSYANINGIRINPVLNVPPANLFGSIFSSGKDKNRKK
ncbi:hypothetical protein Adt_24984 [Abeliophyllum distichum]|uniref:Uncharacterized protein n=1 Tax=Abeliophyllum distichum TaxID=126358 RepID=A0ABD1SIC5_9LAMI